MKSTSTTSKSFILERTETFYDECAFKVFLCCTLFIVVFSVQAIQNWPPLLKQSSILLACLLPVSIVTIVRIPAWFFQKKLPWELLWFCLVFILGMIVSIRSENPWDTAKSTILFLASGPLIFIATNYLFKYARNRIMYLWMTSLLALAFSIFGIFEFFISGKVHLSSANPLPAGASLILLLASPIVLFHKFRSTPVKHLLFSSLITSVLVIISIGKKGPILSLTVIWLIWAWIIFKGLPRVLLKISVLTGCLLLISGVLIPKNKNPLESNMSITLRVEHLFFGLHVFQKNPVWGVGKNTDITKYIDDYSLSFSDKLEKHNYRGYLQKFNTFENIILTSLVELGVLFTITYLGGMVYLFYLTISCSRSSPRATLDKALISSVIVGFIILSLTFDTLKFPNLNWLFHSLLGLIINISQKPIKAS